MGYGAHPATTCLVVAALVAATSLAVPGLTCLSLELVQFKCGTNAGSPNHRKPPSFRAFWSKCRNAGQKHTLEFPCIRNHTARTDAQRANSLAQPCFLFSPFYFLSPWQYNRHPRTFAYRRKHP